MSNSKKQEPMSKPGVAEPCPSEGGERISQDHVIQAINALDAHDATGSGSSWDGRRPSGLSFEKEPKKKKLPLPEDKLSDGLKDEADKLERHTITNEKTFPWCTIGKIYVGKDADFNNPLEGQRRSRRPQPPPDSRPRGPMGPEPTLNEIHPRVRKPRRAFRRRIRPELERLPQQTVLKMHRSQFNFYKSTSFRLYLLKTLI